MMKSHNQETIYTNLNIIFMILKTKCKFFKQQKQSNRKLIKNIKLSLINKRDAKRRNLSK